MKRISVFSCLFFLCLTSFSQEKTFSSDCVYYVKKHEFGKILDDFIEHEKQYDYFDSTCLFGIQLIKIDSTITFVLKSGIHPSEISDWRFWDEINDKYFIIKYYEYYFGLYADDGVEILDADLLIKKNEEFHLKADFKEKDKEHYDEVLGFRLSTWEDV